MLFPEVGMGRFIGNGARCWWQQPHHKVSVNAPRHGKTPTIAAPTKATALRVKRKAVGTLMADHAGHHDFR
jgi:hypothetical protein